MVTFEMAGTGDRRVRIPVHDQYLGTYEHTARLRRVIELENLGPFMYPGVLPPFCKLKRAWVTCCIYMRVGNEHSDVIHYLSIHFTFRRR